MRYLRSSFLLASVICPLAYTALFPHQRNLWLWTAVLPGTLGFVHLLLSAPPDLHRFAMFPLVSFRSKTEHFIEACSTRLESFREKAAFARSISAIRVFMLQGGTNAPLTQEGLGLGAKKPAKNVNFLWIDEHLH